MSLLIAGMLLFMIPHLIPSFPNRRNALIQRLGDNGYRGLYSLLALAGLVLIVIGKGDAAFVHVYTPPAWGQLATSILMLAGIFCLVSKYVPANLVHYTRHPMLWGVTLWSLGHLLANGDLASLILFGGFGLFSLWDMVSSNRRGAHLNRGHYPIWRDGLAIIISLVIYAIMVWAHPWFAGVPLASPL